MEHRALVNKISTLPALLGETVSKPRPWSPNSVNFDPFIEQLMLGLAYGQPVILLVDDELSDPVRFWKTIRKHAVRRADLVPCHCRTLVRALPGGGNVPDPGAPGRRGGAAFPWCG